MCTIKNIRMIIFVEYFDDKQILEINEHIQSNLDSGGSDLIRFRVVNIVFGIYLDHAK